MDNSVMNENRYSLCMQLLLFEAIHEWNYKPNERLGRLLPKKIVDHYKMQNTDILKEMKRYTLRSIVNQYFILGYEMVNGNFDESMNKSKNDFSKMKVKIDENGSLKTVNAKQLLDIMRQSFAHNDDEMIIPNWKFDDENNILIHMQLKNKEVNIKIHSLELVKLINMYMKNATDNPTVGVTMYAKRLSDAIMQHRVSVGNIHKFVGSYDTEKKLDIELDKLQKRALYNFFIKNSEGLTDKEINMGIHPYDVELLNKKYPFKSNEKNIAREYIKTLDLLETLNNINLSKDEFTAKVYYNKMHKQGDNNVDVIDLDVIEVQDYLGSPNRFEANIASNVLFSIFTYIEPSKIKSYLNKDIDLNKIRNSIMHGRFYYNYEDGFNFYDGIINKKNKAQTSRDIENSLQYVGTLSFEDIDTLSRKLLHEYILVNKNIR